MPKSLVIDNLDSITFDRLQDEARRRGSDLSSTAADLLRDGLGRRHAPGDPGTARDLDSLAGTWSDEEADAFLAAISDFGKIDEDLWR